MLTVTESACEHIATMLDEANAPDGRAARLAADGQGLVLTLDEKRDGDSSFDHEGKTVLLIDERTAGLLDTHTLDTKQTEQGVALALSGADEQ